MAVGVPVLQAGDKPCGEKIAHGGGALYKRLWDLACDIAVENVIDVGMQKAVPIEVKSSRNVRSKSLSVYREKYEPPYAIRLSTRNFGFEGGVKSVPLYAAFCLRR